MTVIAIGWNIFPGDAGEGEERDVDGHDDRLTVDRRLHHLLRGDRDFAQALVERQDATQRMLPLREPAKAVLHDDHRAIDDESEVDRPDSSGFR
jgi:hypothetical protein